MAQKKHIGLYLDPDLTARAQKVLAEAGGVVSLSLLVNNYLEQMVPFMEEAVQRAKSGDREAMVQFLDAFVSSNFATLGSELASVHRDLAEQPREERTT